MSEGWAQNLANELHRPIRRRFPKRRVISYGIDNIWAADLVEMGKFSKWNKGIKYLLMVIDVFSKFGWIRLLKDKRGQTVADAFRSIFAERSGAEPSEARRKPKMLWTDKGSEFFNGIMKDLLSKNGIKLYTTENEEKSSVVERWNKTMKEQIFRMFSANNNTIYFDKLDKSRGDKGILAEIPQRPLLKTKEKFCGIFSKFCLIAYTRKCDFLC